MIQGKFFLPALCLIILFSACKKDEDLFELQTVDDADGTFNTAIHPAFEIVVNRFIEEGAKRGFLIDLESRNITIQFTNIDQQQSPNVAGICSYDGHYYNDITIDYIFWEQASDLQREFILFHELGHCYLYRAHLNTALQNGICASIMRGESPVCFDAYTSANRDYYIGELFSIMNDR